MSVPRADDILFDSGGIWLARYGVPYRRRDVAWADPLRTDAAGPTVARADAATCATLFGADGVMRQAAANKLRCSYDYPALTPALMAEPVRANTCLRSEDITHAAWTKGADVLSTSANNAGAPDGTATMNRMVEKSGAVTAVTVTQGVTVTSSEVLACSVFVGASSASRTLRLRVIDGPGSNGFRARINPATGAVTSESVIGSAVLHGTGAEQVGANLWRFWIIGYVSSGATALNVQVVMNDASGNSSYTGDGSSYLSVWGFQLERLGTIPATYCPTSYIPTTSATVTRAAEVVSFPIAVPTPAVGEEWTFYAKLRAGWVNSGTTSGTEGIFVVGGSTSFAADGTCAIDCLHNGSNIQARISANEVGTAAATTVTLDTGTNPIEVLVQIRASGSSHLVYLEHGGASNTSATRAFGGLPWREKTIHLGDRGNGGAASPMAGGIERLIWARGRFTMADMQGAPLP